MMFSLGGITLSFFHEHNIELNCHGNDREAQKESIS